MQTEKVNHGEKMLADGVPEAMVRAIWCACGSHLYSPSTKRWIDVHATPAVVRIQKRRRIVHANPGELACMKGRGPDFDADASE